jgi:hypothetical protein
MKTIKLFVTMMLLSIALGASAQKPAELKEKASKEAKKEAKRLQKEGWIPAPGGLPIERQLDRSYFMQYELNDEMQAKYAFGNAQSTGQFYDAAKLQASEMAKSDLVGKLTIEVTTLLSSQLKNINGADGQTQSAQAAEAKSKSLISQRLSGITPILELQRTLKDGRVEVMVQYAYDKSKVTAPVMKEISEELMNKDITSDLVE